MPVKQAEVHSKRSLLKAMEHCDFATLNAAP